MDRFEHSKKLWKGNVYQSYGHSEMPSVLGPSFLQKWMGFAQKKCQVNICPWGHSAQNSFRCSFPHCSVLPAILPPGYERPVPRAFAPDRHRIVTMTLERQKSLNYNLVKDFLPSFLRIKTLRPRALWLMQSHVLVTTELELQPRSWASPCSSLPYPTPVHPTGRLPSPGGGSGIIPPTVGP